MPEPTTQPAKGRVLPGVHLPAHVSIQACRSCGASIWWGVTRAGRSNPFDVVAGKATTVTHFSTCPNAREHSKR